MSDTEYFEAASALASAGRIVIVAVVVVVVDAGDPPVSLPFLRACASRLRPGRKHHLPALITSKLHRLGGAGSHQRENAVYALDKKGCCVGEDGPYKTREEAFDGDIIQRLKRHIVI